MNVHVHCMSIPMSIMYMDMHMMSICIMSHMMHILHGISMLTATDSQVASGTTLVMQCNCIDYTVAAAVCLVIMCPVIMCFFACRDIVDNKIPAREVGQDLRKVTDTLVHTVTDTEQTVESRVSNRAAQCVQ